MFGRIATTAALMAALAIGTSTRAQEADASRKALDAKVNQAAYRTIDAGFKLFNGGDQAGCYRLYQGSLTALLPLLDYRDDLRAAVESAMAEADRLPDVAGRAFALRKGLDAIYRATAGPRPAANAGARTLWTRLGGEPAVKAVVHDFVALAASDPKVDFTRGGKYPIDAAGVANLETLLIQLVSATTGGPLKYTGRDMKELHRGMKITDEQFNALAADLIATLDKYKVPAKEKDQLVAIVASTRAAIVEAGAAPTADAPPPAPMPDKPMPDKPMPDKPKDEKPLWDRLGGEDAVKAVVHDFVAKAAGDEKVNFTRDGKYKLDDAGIANLERLLVEQISAGTGGPIKYSGRGMKELHKGMKITDEEFDALAADLVEVLKDYKVPQKEIDELVGIVASTKKDIVEGK